MKQVKGKLIDNETRCSHYNSKLDIIAIKFKCCGTYYPCFKCHQECTDHETHVWPKKEFSAEAILCGVCKTELTIERYLTAESQCPSCGSHFNPKCKLHYHLYFEC